MDYGKYPKNWKEISLAIRKRSGGRCECEGECGADRENEIKAYILQHFSPQ